MNHINPSPYTFIQHLLVHMFLSSFFHHAYTYAPMNTWGFAASFSLPRTLGLHKPGIKMLNAKYLLSSSIPSKAMWYEVYVSSRSAECCSAAVLSICLTHTLVFFLFSSSCCTATSVLFREKQIIQPSADTKIIPSDTFFKSSVFPYSSSPYRVFSPAPSFICRPGGCSVQGSRFSSSTTLPDEVLNFVKTHPLMDETVPLLGHRPWVVKTMGRCA